MNLSLESLLHPVRVEDFLSQFWEKAPLFVTNRGRDYFDSLLGVSDIDYLISTASSSDAASVELLKATGETQAIDPRRPDRLTSLYQAFNGGATVRVNGAQRFWKPLHAACRELENYFGAPVRVNLYCTPAGARGAPLHYDNHEVFVAHLHGSKHWRVYNPVVELPLETVAPLPFEERGAELKYYRGGPRKSRSDIDEETAGAPVLEETLTHGDALYVPRGFVHQAATADAASAHLTFGVHVLTLLDLLTVALTQLGNADVRFRAALKPGHLSDPAAAGDLRETFGELLQTFARRADPAAALNEIGGSFVRSRQGVGDGTLFDAKVADSINDDTILERSAGLVLRLASGEDATGLESATDALLMPKAFGTSLGFVARTRRFAVREIPGGLSERSKQALARRLVAEGFFRVVKTG